MTFTRKSPERVVLSLSSGFYRVLLSDYADGRESEKGIMSRDFSCSYRGSYLFVFTDKVVCLWRIKIYTCPA